MSARKVANQLQAATRTRVSAQTIRQCLYRGRLWVRRPYVGVPLTRRNRQDRVNWARNHRRWTQPQNNILFTDESRSTVDFSNGRARVWRRSGECYHEQNRYVGGSVMVWGGIKRNTKTDLITVQGMLTAAGYCAQIVQPVIVPFTRQRPGVIIQQNNARPHTARYTMEVLNNSNVQLLEWPSPSSDLSPIEYIWDVLGCRVREHHNVNNVRDLERALHREWNNIPMAEVNRLVSSIRRRCLAVIDSNGRHTQY